MAWVDGELGLVLKCACIGVTPRSHGYGDATASERIYPHVYMLSLNTKNIYKMHNKSSINKYKNTYKRGQW